MDKQLEFFDVVANTQKQAFNDLLSAQYQRVQWIDGISKTHAAITSIPGLPENVQPTAALNQFNSWMSNLTSQSHNATEEILKAQESWISTYEKQLAVSRDILTNFITLGSAALPKVA